MKKGFTLVELLAVIVILGVISMVTYGIVTNNIKTTKKKSFEISAQNLLESSKEYVTKYMDNNDFPEGGIEVTSEELELKNNPFISGIVKKDENGQIVLENVTDGNYCANGTKNSMEINEGTCGGESDETLPTLKVKQLKVGTTTAQIMIKTQDSGSGIKSYDVCKEQECTTYEKEEIKTLVKEVVKLEGLNPNTEYKITVTSKDVSDNQETKTLMIKTLEVEAPEFRISTKTHATNKMLEIIYPVNDGNYEYFYNTIIENKETKEKITKEYTTEETKVELKIEKAMEVEAYIKKGVDIVAQNSITIGGIDLEGPIVNLVVPDTINWVRQQNLKIESQDNVGGVGLALRPYSFDGGKNWIKNNEQEFKTSISKLDIKSRDRLGNNNEKFTLNGVKCDATSETHCSLKNIDSVAPKINIAVNQKPLKNAAGKEYYIDKTIVVDVTITNYYLLDGKEVIGGAPFDRGPGKDTLAIKWKGTKLDCIKGEQCQLQADSTTEILHYQIELIENGLVEDKKIDVEISDTVGNKGTASKTINIDRVVPVIIFESNPLGLGTGEYTFTKNIKVVNYGPLGGTINECDPAESKKTGNYKVICKATGTNGLTASQLLDVQHSYEPTIGTEYYVCRTNCKKSYSCSNPHNCHSGESWRNETICEYSCTDGVKRDNVKSYTCKEYGWCGAGSGWSGSDPTPCPADCTRKTYSCPQPGSHYNSSTKLCEY